MYGMVWYGMDLAAYASSDRLKTAGASTNLFDGDGATLSLVPSHRTEGML